MTSLVLQNSREGSTRINWLVGRGLLWNPHLWVIASWWFLLLEWFINRLVFISLFFFFTFFFNDWPNSGIYRFDIQPFLLCFRQTCLITSLLLPLLQGTVLYTLSWARWIYWILRIWLMQVSRLPIIAKLVVGNMFDRCMNLVKLRCVETKRSTVRLVHVLVREQWLRSEKVLHSIFIFRVPTRK